MVHWESLPQLAVSALLAAVAVVVTLAATRGGATRLFAAYLLLVSGNFAAGWLSLALPESGGAWRLVADVLLFLDAAALLAFVNLHPRPTPLARRRDARLSLAVVLASVLAWRASYGLDAPSNEPSFYRFVALGLFGAAYAVALFTAIRQYASAEFRGTRAELRPLVAGLVGVIAPRLGLLETDFALFRNGAADPVAITIRVGVTLLVLLLALAAWRRGEPAAEAAKGRRWRALAAVFVGAVCAAWILAPLSTNYDVSLAWLYAGRWVLFALLVAGATARHEFLGADRHVIASVRAAAAAVTALVVFVLVRPALNPLAGHDRDFPFAPGDGLAVALALAAGAGGAAVARRVGVARGSVTLEALAARKLDAYQTLVEAAIEAGLAPDAPELAERRRRLGVTNREHDGIVALVDAERAARAARGPATALPRGYRLVETLATGDATWTLLAESTDRGERVVVKVLRPEWRHNPRAAEAFRREARVLAGVRHPNVVRALDVVESPPAIVLELAAGGTLAERVASRGPLAPAEVERLARDVLTGLGALHAAGLVHRDVTPANVLFGADGRAAISDLGIAVEVAGAAGTRRSLATPADGPGTPLYMAPEQILGRAVDARTDFYAAGAVLVLASTGRHYLGAEALPDFEAKRLALDAECALLDDLPPRVRPLVAACLAKRPDRRPASAAAALALLPPPDTGR